MFFAAGYETRSQLHESEQSLVFRAVREADGLLVILKVLKDVRPTPERIARFKREYQIVKGLNLPGVVKAHDFVHSGRHWLFVQEDFGGESLAQLGLAGRIEVGEFLAVAGSIAGHVADVHQEAVIHKDLNPANIVFDRGSGAVKLIDFGIATRLSRETVAFDHPSQLEGTPAYLSPEQTGRINQPLDHRADLYSLGCTFYELLTGRPPYEAADLVELLHYHLARAPEPLRARRPDVPPILSAIIEKLMAKNASGRYQSARGLQSDLDRCRRAWRAEGHVPSITLGSHDVAQRLSPPTRLYGRSAEVDLLLSAFERAAAGATELVMVSGHPGVGKSALVKELYRPVTQRRGFFVAGKFDQIQRDTPYGPIVSALDGLIGYVLMEPPAPMAAWAAAIHAASAGILPALTGLLPRLELLHGRLPAGPTPAAEAGRYFIEALAGLVRVFAGPEHPLVLFIDDLQWADGASLDLIKRLMTGTPIPHLLIVGAYRHNEAPAAHPLRAMLADVRAAGVSMRELHLEPLDAEDSAALLADTLHREIEDVREPAQLIHQKTGGNPLFVQTFLDTLVARGVVTLDHAAGVWRWDAEGLRLLDLSENVVEILIESLQELPSPTRDLLAQAAYIGNHFELGLLAAVAGRAAEEVAQALMPALARQYLIPTTGDYRLFDAGIEGLSERIDVAYKFGHDRIQQAAYGLRAAGEHAAIHLRIGRAMRAYYTGKSADAHLLAIVNQLNQARRLIEDEDERRDVATLDLKAGRRARAAVANAAALAYFEHGLLLLGAPPDGESEPSGVSPAVHERAFRAGYALALALTEGAADAAYLVPDFATMERHLDALLRHASQFMERVNVLQIRIDAHVARYQFPAAIATAREILEPLGVALPVEPAEADVEAAFLEVEREMGPRRPRDLLDLADIDDAEPKAALHILSSLRAPTYLTQPLLAPLVAAEMVLLSLRHGLSDDSINGFIFYGMALCGRDRLDLGYEFGCLAESLVEKRRSKALVPDVAVLGNAYIFHWQRPMRDVVPKMRDGYRAGLETGNIAAAANCLQGSSAMGFLSGSNLAQLDEQYAESAVALERHKQGPFLMYLRLYHQAVRNLRGLSREPTRLQGDTYDEATELPVHERTGDMSAIFSLHFLRTILCYHFHDYKEALRLVRVVEKGNQPGSLFIPIAFLYQCLSLLATHGDAPLEEQPAILREASALVERMKWWGAECPVNYAHKYHLMAAELARVAGRISEARDHYDRAIDLAHEHEYTHEEGLALERAALFFLDRGDTRLAGHYMRDAHYTYGVWGGAAKRDFLRRRYGYLLQREGTGRVRAAGQPRAEAKASTTTTSEFGDLDLGTLLAATRAVARETDLRRLLETVMQVSLVNAGAERGFLILARAEQLIVKARGEVSDEARFESLSLALHDQDGIARSVVQYVARTAQPVLLADAAAEGMFINDPHVRASGCRSLLCVPILYQGRLVAVSYLENNRAASVFNEDRLDVLTLLMGQAAVSIENALLKESDELRDLHFRVGGSLPADSPAYVRREADALLADNIRRGELSYVFNTRQMGKSSLRVRAVDRLGKAGVACVSIDLTSIGSREVTAEQWYAGVARMLVSGLGLQRDLDLRRWWRDRADFSPVQRLDALIDEEILARVDRPIAVFVDEVDAVLGLDFSPDDFFALVRLFYNRRASDPRYARLTFILLGVAAPTDLVRDKLRTPFNIGRAVPLAGFRYDEALSLTPGLSRAGDGEQILRAVLDWSGGQPFLTQKLCRLVVEDESRPPPGKEREWVANLVRSRVIDKWRHRDEPEHLKTIEARILRAPGDVAALLALYRRIREQGEVDAGESPLEGTLLLSGLVTQAFDKLRVGNPIYAAVFDDDWIDAGLSARG
ncbi:AAA family ATPase [Sorangium sp. So ce131]|uniref:AAA family ATPase n=1 Tax=Sorangium sp. So ce131 TaxID=3133282 RepID=UPI003F607116